MKRAPARGWFVTGTDTGVGKTVITAGLMEAFGRRGLAVAGMKPVASGCARTADGRLENEDARALRARCTHEAPYERVNPCALAPPIAPSIALARAGGGRLDTGRILDACARLGADADVLLVEGVGGWRVPLDDTLDLAGLARLLGLPVLLVVGLRLGCINHARLTADALGSAPAGWFANRIDPDYDGEDETVALLTRHIGQAPLAVLPHRPGPDPTLPAALLDRAAARLWTGRDP